MDSKSPFKVYQDFISPKVCDEILSHINIKEPNRDPEGIPTKMEYSNDPAEDIIFDKLKPHIDELQDYYDINYKGTERITFQMYPEGMKGHAEDPFCVNARYLRRKWVKVSDAELTGVLWLKDYQDKPPLDTRYEVYGGKLEFPAYDFSLVPQRGTLIIFPAGPHFIQAISPVMVGTLYQARINIVTKDQYFYQPKKFPGNWKEWFKEYF